MSVGTHFKERPFVVRAGLLSKAAGEGRFVEYGSVSNLKQVVESTFNRPVSFRLVFGSHGVGKTWTLSWLWREFSIEQGPRKTLVVGIPKFEIRERPERSMVESILSSVAESYPALYAIGSSQGAGNASWDLRSLRDHFRDFQSRQTLVGASGASRVGASENARGFSLTKLDDLRRMLLATFEAASLAGYGRCLVLADELEAPFLLSTTKDRVIFFEFLRGIYDVLERPSKSGPKYPHVQFLFSGTQDVFNEFVPGTVTTQRGGGSLMAAFVRRTETPFLLKPPTKPELEQITLQEIQRTRRKKESGTIPFELNAILMAWERSSHNLGDFLHLVSDMYALAETEDAKRVSKEHCERALKSYNADDALR
jgi:hypothetical protein